MMEIKSWCLALLILNCCEGMSIECMLYAIPYSAISDWAIKCTWYVENVSRNWRYTCVWYVLRSDMTIASIAASESITSYYFQGNPKLYYKWECTMTTRLPKTDGEYIYYFQDLNKRNTEAKRLEIRFPGQPSTHSCPQSILEGIRLICNCTTPNSGNPPGILSWPGYTNTSQLIVDHVRRGSQFTCQLQWNGMFANVTYSPQVKHPPTSPPVLSGYTSRDSLWEGSSLTLNCTVHGGKPPVLSVNVFCESGVAIQPGTLETRGESVTRSVLLGPLKAEDNGTNCWCNATWHPEPAYFQDRTYLILTVFTLPEKNAFPMAAIIGCGCGVVLILTGVVVISVVIITKRKERTKNLYGMDKENNGTIRSPDLSIRNENTNEDPTLQYLTAEGAVYSVIKKPSERRQTENGKYSDKNDIRSSATGNINNEEHSVPHHTANINNEEHSVPHHIAVIPSNLGQNFQNDVYAVPEKKLKLVAKVRPNLKPKPPSFSEGANVRAECLSLRAEGLSLRAEGPCEAPGIPSETDYYNICQQSFSMTHSYDNVELRPAETNVNSSNITQGDAQQEMQQGDAHQLTQNDSVQEVTQNDGMQEVTQQDNAEQVKQNNDGDEYDVLRLSHNAYKMQFSDPLYNHI